MRRLALVLLLALATPGAIAQRQQQTPNQPQPPNTKPGPVRVEPNWSQVTAAQRSQQVQSLDQLQSAIKQQQAGQRPSDLQGKLSGFVTQAATVNAAVLIPLSAARADTTELVTGKTFYNFSASYPGGQTSSVLGMCSGTRLPDDHPLVRSMQAETRQRPLLPSLGERYQITATETGNQMTFSKFGCAYEIELTCTASCNAERELTDIASNLVVINAR